MQQNKIPIKAGNIITISGLDRGEERGIEI
jgi:hypothetical protein